MLRELEGPRELEGLRELGLLKELGTAGLWHLCEHCLLLPGQLGCARAASLGNGR